jgi:hypothetical protein
MSNSEIGVGTGIKLFFGFVLGAIILVVVVGMGGCAACLAIVGYVGSQAPPPKSANAPAAPADGLAPYKANIGKTAFNTANGQEQGRIVDVGYEGKGADRIVVYKIRYKGKVRTHPVDQTEVRDVPATVAEP